MVLPCTKRNGRRCDIKIASIVGARPNFVKLAGLIPYIDVEWEHVIIHTGQHYDYELSKIFFKHLNIPEPDYFLGVGSGSHGYQTGEMIKRIEGTLLKEKPDLVIVYGDTNSTLAGALAAVKAGFRVAHVEAGLRSYDFNMPEEINRRVTDHISWLLFAPTDNAVTNLLRENVMGEIYLTGDIHVDVLYRWIEIAENRSTILSKLGLRKGEYIVATIHRAENTDDEKRLRRIIEILTSIAERSLIVFPIHPRTRKALKMLNLLEKLVMHKNILLIDPLSYLDFIKLLKYSKLVITDSGGVQREAYLLGKKTLVVRDRTEWVELVREGYVVITDIDINKAMKNLATNTMIKQSIKNNILGDGRTGYRIMNILSMKLSGNKPTLM